MRCALAITLTLSTAFALARVAGAHGEDAVLYVADGGEDAGLCNETSNPCRSIGYALGRAGKATEIRVAGGRYDLADAETLFHLVSGVVEIRGGYDRDDFTTPGVTVSTLTGVPLKYREVLGSRDFHVIVDRKGLPGISAESTDKMLSVHRSLKSGAAAEACTDGMAGDLECEQVELIGHIAFSDFRSRPSAANDIWGFIDLNSGREYVIAGFNTGTAVLDIGDPENPREVGFVPGDNSNWRDVKVLQRYDDSRERWVAYAYVTTDAASDGLFIIDLTNLPHAIDRVAYQSDFQQNHNLFLTNTDASTGLATGDRPQYLVLAGSDRNAGQARAYALDDPESPTLVQGDAIPDSFGAGDRSYAHDLASLTVRDGRVSQCPNATASCDVLLDFNEQNIEVWDMTDVADPVRLNPGQPQYPQRGYVHSGWPTEDGQYMFVQDETDERDLGIATRLRVFSLADLSNPELVGSWQGPTNATDHNGFVRGNRYYMSNYSRGLTVLDITDPETPEAVGRLDTYIGSDSTGFIGAWGVYPYFASGTIAVSDIESGVYLVRDRTRDVAQGSLDFENASHAAIEGQDAALVVRRTGGTGGAVSVDYEVVRGTAGGDDYTTSFTTLNWADGDDSDRTITLSPTNDGTAEGSELLLVRLVNPTGGATLGERNMTRVHLGDPGDAATIRAFADAIEVDEDGFGRAVLVLQRHGSAAGSASIDYAVSGGSATPDDDYLGPASGTVEWPDGDANPKTISWDIQGDGIEEEAETFDVSLSNATGATLTGAATVQVTIAAASDPPSGGGGGGGGGGNGDGGGSSGGGAGWALLALLFGCLARPISVYAVGTASRRD